MGTTERGCSGSGIAVTVASGNRGSVRVARRRGNDRWNKRAVSFKGLAACDSPEVAGEILGSECLDENVPVDLPLNGRGAVHGGPEGTPLHDVTEAVEEARNRPSTPV